MSSPQNPILELPAPATPPPVENPPWSLWDVVQLAALTFLTPILFLILGGAAAQHFLYKSTALTDVVQKPSLSLLAELLAYGVVLFCMVALVHGKTRQPFLVGVGWNWPQRKWGLISLGVALLFALQLVGHFLPIPKNVPFDKFFAQRTDAYLTSLFAISVGPLMEELFFRGFLYPVLARRMRMGSAVVVTALAFGSVHSLQLAFSWAAVLVIVIVGLVLTMVRAVTHSVGSSFLVHVAYNATLTVLTFVGTDGFRHMERLNQ